MSRYVLVGLTLCLCFTCFDQLSAQTTDSTTTLELSSLLNPTSEMWFYAQELQRYDDPKLSVRRKAEGRAKSRRNRLAAMRWFGLSKARPEANPTPWFGTYLPVWRGNHSDPYRWHGIGNGMITVGRSYPMVYR